MTLRPCSEPVYVDRTMWETIILNLLSNAFKFTFDGEIAVSLQEQDAQAVLTIRDTGTGIPPEELPRLFDRFHRVEGAKGRSFEGSGIGLALVKELVVQHGGQISVQSEVGLGTSFAVSLPLGRDHLEAERIDLISRRRLTGQQGRILRSGGASFAAGRGRSGDKCGGAS